MSFELPQFLPYLLNQAAEAASREFQAYYRGTYGMLRTEWRVLFHLGIYGEMTATQICERAALHKTKVSRAVRALEQKRYVVKAVRETDRRTEALSLTAAGRRVFDDLHGAAARYDARMVEALGEAEARALRASLLKLSGG